MDASALLAKFECNRCHEGGGMPVAAADKQCVGCHQQIHAGTFAAKPEVLAAWRGKLTSMRWTPSLDGADRLRRSWVRAFLLAPHDVRPDLVGEMPRLAVTPDEATRIAAHLVPREDAAPQPGDAREIARGEELYRSLACGRCHRFGGASVDDAALHTGGNGPDEAQLRAWSLAPDLRHARARMDLAQIATWIAAPRGAMPPQGVTPEHARALAAFVVHAPLAPAAPPPPVQRLPVLAREVRWDEVATKVFHTVCWHCHAAPDLSRGDGGPGSSGGFGFAPRGLDLSSYTAIAAGSLDDAGEPRSVFAPLPDGTPRLVAHLLARHAEHAGTPMPGIRGMPLGLPALSLEQIQLVETWIAQGRPQ